MVVLKPAIAILAMFAATTAAAQERPVAYAHQVTASYTFDLAPAPDDKQAVLIRVISGREQLFLRRHVSHRRLIPPSGSLVESPFAAARRREWFRGSPQATRSSFTQIRNSSPHRIEARQLDVREGRPGRCQFWCDRRMLGEVIRVLTVADTPSHSTSGQYRFKPSTASKCGSVV